MLRSVAAVLLWICAASAQTIRVDVREVLVPVIVTDSKGHHVTGLKAADFQVEEDGVQQEIAAFSTDSAPAASAMLTASNPQASGGGPVKGPAAVGHTFVICVDTLHSSSANSARTRETLAKLFEKEKNNPGTRYSVLALGRQLRVLQTATNDPSVVMAKLKNPSLQLGGGDAATLTSELSELKNRMYDFCRRCTACSSRTNNHACDGDIQSLKISLDAQAERWGQLTGQLLSQIKAVVEELAKLPDGRTLVLVSDGFSLQPTREFYGLAASFIPGDSRFAMSGPTDLESRLQGVMKVAVEQNVRIYAVDSRGIAQASLSGNGSMDASAPPDRSVPSVILRGSSSRGGTLLTDMDHEARSVAFQNGSAMEQMARTTGGVFFHDSNDMLKQFRSVLADGHEYYLLGYVPKNSAQDGTFRTIKVDVAGKKLHIRAKSGYWAPAVLP